MAMMYPPRWGAAAIIVVVMCLACDTDKASPNKPSPQKSSPQYPHTYFPNKGGWQQGLPIGPPRRIGVFVLVVIIYGFVSLHANPDLADMDVDFDNFHF